MAHGGWSNVINQFRANALQSTPYNTSPLSIAIETSLLQVNKSSASYIGGASYSNLRNSQIHRKGAPYHVRKMPPKPIQKPLERFAASAIKCTAEVGQ